MKNTEKTEKFCISYNVLEIIIIIDFCLQYIYFYL